MIPFNFRIKILAIRALLCTLGSKGLKQVVFRFPKEILLDKSPSIGTQVQYVQNGDIN